MALLLTPTSPLVAGRDDGGVSHGWRSVRILSATVRRLFLARSPVPAVRTNARRTFAERSLEGRLTIVRDHVVLQIPFLHSDPCASRRRRLGRRRAIAGTRSIRRPFRPWVALATASAGITGSLVLPMSDAVDVCDCDAARGDDRRVIVYRRDLVLLADDDRRVSSRRRCCSPHRRATTTATGSSR